MDDNSHVDLVISEILGFIFVPIYKSLLTPWSMLYLKLGIGSRIFYVGLVQLNVQPAEFSRAVQGNLKRSFKTSSDQFVLKPANLARVTSPRGTFMVCSTAALEFAKVIHVITTLKVKCSLLSAPAP